MRTKTLFQLASALAVGATTLLGVGPASAAPVDRQNTVTLARPITPTIDGNLSEWGTLPNAINQMVYGPQNWIGAGDNSATYSMGWDANKLYLAAYVKDDVFVQNQTGESIFKGDSLELLFDTNLAADSHSVLANSDDYQLGISPGGLTSGNNPAPQAYLWLPTPHKGVPAGVTVASSKVGDGYAVEAAIPWNLVGASPYAGARYGFALSTSDNDAQNAAVQQTLVSSVAGRIFNNPTTWGTLILDNVTTHAVKLGGAPTIDGNLGEWGTLNNGINQVVFGPQNWVGANDASATYKIGWDANKLYIAAYVKDDVFVQNQSGANLFRGDSLELMLDTNLGGDSSNAFLNSDDYQLGISPGGLTSGNNPAPQVYRWYPSNLKGGLSNVAVASSKVGDGYLVEAAIPWSVLGVTPYGGLSMGFALSVSDNDASGQALQQTLVSSNGLRKLTNPNTWGVLTLDN